MLAGMIAAPARHLAAHELGIHPLANGDKLHLRGDLATPGEGELADRSGPPERPPHQPRWHLESQRLVAAALRHVAREDPVLPEPRQPLVHVVPLGAAGVVDPERRVGRPVGRVRERDFAHRDPDAVAAGNEHLRRAGKGVGEGAGRLGGRGHRATPVVRSASLRRSEPGQVPRVPLNPGPEVGRDAPGGRSKGTTGSGSGSGRWPTAWHYGISVYRLEYWAGVQGTPWPPPPGGWVWM